MDSSTDYFSCGSGVEDIANNEVPPADRAPRQVFLTDASDTDPPEVPKPGLSEASTKGKSSSTLTVPRIIVTSSTEAVTGKSRSTLDDTELTNSQMSNNESETVETPDIQDEKDESLLSLHLEMSGSSVCSPGDRDSSIEGDTRDSQTRPTGCLTDGTNSSRTGRDLVQVEKKGSDSVRQRMAHAKAWAAENTERCVVKLKRCDQDRVVKTGTEKMKGKMHVRLEVYVRVFAIV